MNHYHEPAMSAFEFAVTKTVELERIQFAQTFEIDADVLAERSRLDFMTNDVGSQLARIYHHVYARKAEQVVEYPATWWDAFKLRWFPRWAIKRWPAANARVVVKAQALFPELGGIERRARLVIYVSDRVWP